MAVDDKNDTANKKDPPDQKSDDKTAEADGKEDGINTEQSNDKVEDTARSGNDADIEDDEEEEEEEEEEDPLYAQLASKYSLKVDEKLQEIEEEEERIEKKEKIEQEIQANPDKAVDLSKLNTRYNVTRKSALQNILVEYGLPDENEEKESKKPKVTKKKKRRQEYSDSEAESEREQIRTERNDRDKYRLADYIREEDYMETLEAKIAKQRKEISKRSEELDRRLKEREQKHFAETRFQKKMERHDLTHDASYMKTVPKSNTYKVIVYENKLKAAGKLNRRSDIEEFWLHSKDHQILKEYVRKQGLDAQSSQAPSSPIKADLEDSFISSRTSSLSSIDYEKEKEKTHVDFRPLTQIEEAMEPSRPSTRDANASQPWAVTQQFPSKHGPQKKSQDPYTIAKQAAVELDKKHPMMQLPPLSCFMDLGDNTVDPEEVLKQMQAERREKERKLFVKRIRKMYHLAQANSAATQRIMEKRDDFIIDREAPPAATWLSSYTDLDETEQIPLTEEEKFFQARPWLRYVRHRAILPIEEESEPPSQKTSASVLGRQRSSGVTRNGSGFSSINSREERRPLPLALPALENTSKVVEAKCRSTLWTNYLGVGKSVFAK